MINDGKRYIFIIKYEFSGSKPLKLYATIQRTSATPQKKQAKDTKNQLTLKSFLFFNPTNTAIELAKAVIGEI